MEKSFEDKMKDQIIANTVASKQFETDIIKDAVESGRFLYEEEARKIFSNLVIKGVIIIDSTSGEVSIK